MNAVEIVQLLERPESETLDFKASGYDLSDKRKKRNFAKDIASLANTPREGEAYIVLGVKKQRDGSFELPGLDQDIDDADLQSVASSLLEPSPHFVYQPIRHDGVILGLITVFVDQQSPVVPRKTEDSGFSEGKIYFRRGSQNAPASTQEQGQIWDWFRGRGTSVPTLNPYARASAWAEYLAEVDTLRPSACHILILDDCLGQDAEDLSGLGYGPWTYVLDFDTRSDTDGFLASVRSTIEIHRSLHIRVKGDPRTSRSPSVTTTWFFAHGLEGRTGSIPSGGIRGWRRDYRQVLHEEFQALSSELTPATVHVTILWRNPELGEHLAEVLRSLDESLHDSFRPVFVTEVPAVCESLASEFNAAVMEMSLHEFARGVQQVFEDKQLDGSGDILLPSASGVPVRIEPQIANWIAEEIELVPLGDPKSEEGIGTFLRGGTVTWAELDRNLDARRDVQTRLTEAVRRDLENSRITRVNLFHRPGAGGTTVGRRVAWELHEEYACGLLKRTVPMETADRLASLHDKTQGPVLLIADGTDIAQRELDELTEYLGARRIPVVLLQIRRRQAAIPQQRDRTFDLHSELSAREVDRFISALSHDVPNRADALEKLGRSTQHTLHRPVYFALTAYERDFRALPSFVSSRIADLNDDQAKMLVYAAIALQFGQRGLPVGSLRAIFGLSPSDQIDMSLLLPEATVELFIESSPGEWRVGHSLVADELLQQRLSSGGDRRTWRNHLTDWGIDFIRFCRGDLPVLSVKMLELVRRVFVFRDDVDILGREQSAQRRFSNFIQEVPVSEGKLRVLEELVSSFPEEHHFWAHLARFYALDRQDFAEALKAANHAVQLSDRDSVVYHMRGMVLRYQLRELQREETPLEDLVAIAEKASLDFERSRSLNPENEHGYITEAQMTIELLDHVGRSSGDLFRFLTGHNVPPYLREALDRVESLLAYVKREREGIGASQYEVRATARVQELYGDYVGAIRRLDSLTSRLDVYQPPIRRQLAWAYLARAGGDWSRVPKRQIRRVVQLLDRNLEEEPRGEQNIRLWMQASRFQEEPPSLESVIEQVQYWRAEPGAVDAVYYAYVLNALLAMDGLRLAFRRYEQHLEECRELTRFRRNRDRSYEWLGDGPGIGRLVHQSRLGDWDHDRGFWENTKPLMRVRGRVARINGPQAGVIELAGGLEAFFVPAKSRLYQGSENTPVTAFLGFSYDGPRVWGVSREEDI